MEVEESLSTEMQGSSPSSTSTSSNGDGKDRRTAAGTANTAKNGGDTSMNVIEIDSGDEVDENKDPGQQKQQQQQQLKDASKGKNKTLNTKQDKGKGKEKLVVAPKKRKSESNASKAKNGNESSDDDDDNVTVTSSKQAKKPKLDKAKQTSSSAVKPALNANAGGDGLVSFKNNKLVVKQKKLDLANRNEYLQKRMAWNQFLEDVQDPLEGVPEEHYPLIALLVQESEKTLAELTKFVKAALAPVASGDEDSQQTVDLVPNSIINKAIKFVAQRVNYGYRDNPATGDDAENADDDEDRDLPQGYDTVPAHLRVWRWEVQGKDAMFECLPADLREKINARVEERNTIRDLVKKLLASLSEEEQKEILSKGAKSADAKDKEAGPSKKTEKATGKGKKKAAESDAEEGGEASTSAPKKKKKKDMTEEELAEEAEKQQKKEEEKAKKEEEKAERARKKAERDAVKAEKEAAKAKIEQAKKKQSNMFGNWLAKAGISPPLGSGGSDSGTFPASTPMKQQRSSSAASGSATAPDGGNTTTAPTSAVQHSEKKHKKLSGGEQHDYGRTFLPFNVKQGFVVAPINRFLKRKEVVKLEVDDMDEDEPETPYSVNSHPELSIAESLQDFLSRADKRRIPSSSTSRNQHNVSDLMAAINEAELCGNKVESNRLRAILRNPAKVPMKLFKFKEDVRPAYFGTWTKTSSAISGRRPLAMDESLLSYDYDSEAEWEEDPDDAENLESEEDADEESDDDMDGWLAGDDEQIEMEEGYEDMAIDPNDPLAVEVAKNKTMTMKTAPKKRKVTGPLIAIIKGPYYEDEASDDDSTRDLQKYFESFKIQFLGSQSETTLDPFTKLEKKARPSLKTAVSTNDAPTSNPSSASKDANKGEGRKAVLDPALLPALTAFVLASTQGNKVKLAEEAATALSSPTTKIKQSAVSRKIEELFTKKKGPIRTGEGLYELQKQAAAETVPVQAA